MSQDEKNILIGPIWAPLFFDIISIFCSITTLLAMIQRVGLLPVKLSDNIKNCDEQVKYKVERFRDIAKRIFFLIDEVEPTFADSITAIENMTFSINKYKYVTYAQLKQELTQLKSEIDLLEHDMELFIVENELKKKGTVPAEGIFEYLNALLQDWGKTPFSDFILGLKKINKDIFNLLHR